MLESYLHLAANTFFSNLIIPVTQPYVEKVMMVSMLPYNHVLIALIVFVFIMLAMAVNMLFGFVVYRGLNGFVSEKGSNHMVWSSYYFYKYCLLFCPLLSFISPLLLIVFATLCGFLRLFKWRIFIALSFEFLSNFIKYLI